MDRPSRKTKAVNYRELIINLDEDDDDFAFIEAPPRKKVKEDAKQREQKKSLSTSSSQDTNPQKSRRPLDQRLQERDLEAAITLSLLNNPEETKDKSSGSDGVMKVHVRVDENTDPASQHLSNCSVDGAVFGLEEITSETGSAASTVEQKQTLKEHDEDYRPKLTPDSESDDDFSEAEESEDDEFTVKKVTKMKKEKVNKKEKTKSPPASKKEKQPLKLSRSKSAAEGSTPVRSPAAPKPAPKRPATCSTPATSKPALSLSPSGGRIPKWNPPGQIGKSPTSTVNSAVKSPGQGLRLGLSRLVRVKPLHPSVASH